MIHPVEIVHIRDERTFGLFVSCDKFGLVTIAMRIEDASGKHLRTDKMTLDPCENRRLAEFFSIYDQTPTSPIAEALANPVKQKDIELPATDQWNCGNGHLHAERVMRLLESRPHILANAEPGFIERLDNLAYECGPSYCRDKLGDYPPF